MNLFRKPKDDEEIIVVGECDCGAMADRCVCNTQIVRREEQG